LFLFELLNLGEGFKKYFEILPALTDELRDEVYRIRHSVYCEELGWEPVRADGRERDEYDAHALHCLIRSVFDQSYVGCTRLVLAKPGAPRHPLPFEKSCAQTLDRSIVDPQALPRHTIAEVSRLAVVSRYRRRKGEDKVAVSISEDSFGTHEQPRFPYIPVALYLGTIELAALHGIDTLFVLTEPRLASHFSKLGVRIQQIGGPIEHRGTRVPSMMSVQSILSGLNFVVRPLYKVISAEMRALLENHRA
jgi:N-acyl amino acid synthase of PEP-CTERM/exosortase system